MLTAADGTAELDLERLFCKACGQLRQPVGGNAASRRGPPSITSCACAADRSCGNRRPALSVPARKSLRQFPRRWGPPPTMTKVIRRLRAASFMAFSGMLEEHSSIRGGYRVRRRCRFSPGATPLHSSCEVGMGGAGWRESASRKAPRALRPESTLRVVVSTPQTFRPAAPGC